MNAAYFQLLFEYTYWAHRKIWACIEALTDEQYTRALGYSWGSIRGQAVHVMGAEMMWLARLRGTSPRGLPLETDYPLRADLRAVWDTVEADVRAYLTALSDADVMNGFTYTTTKGVEHHQPIYEVLAHLANHGTDHRAQMLAMLHQLGAPTIEQDMVHFFRERR